MSAFDDAINEATADVVSVDFSGALDFDALVGEFGFKVLSAKTGTSQAGNPKVTVSVEVLHGEDENGKDQTGRKAIKDLPLTGKGAGITKKFLKVAEYEGWETVEQDGISLSRLVDLQFTGKCRPSKINDDFTDIYAVSPYADSQSL